MNLQIERIEGAFEIFKDIPGLNGCYQASNLGRIKSLSRLVENRTGKRLTPEKIISPSISRGYLRVSICINGIVKNYSVHRLIAMAFIPNPQNKHNINHINGNRSDNKIENLEWCTYSENMQHAIHILKRKTGRRYKIICINDGIIYDSSHHAARSLNLSQGNISEICKGRRKQTNGFYFKFLEHES